MTKQTNLSTKKLKDFFISEKDFVNDCVGQAKYLGSYHYSKYIKYSHFKNSLEKDDVINDFVIALYKFYNSYKNNRFESIEHIKKFVWKYLHWRLDSILTKAHLVKIPRNLAHIARRVLSGKFVGSDFKRTYPCHLLAKAYCALYPGSLDLTYLQSTNFTIYDIYEKASITFKNLKVPKRLQQVFKYRIKEGLNYRQIAKMLKVSHETIRKDERKVYEILRTPHSLNVFEQAYREDQEQVERHFVIDREIKNTLLYREESEVTFFKGLSSFLSSFEN